MEYTAYSRPHSRFRQLFLVGGLILMSYFGIASSMHSDSPKHERGEFGLTLPAPPAAHATTVATMTKLPGKDGSAPVPEAKPAPSPAVVAQALPQIQAVTSVANDDARILGRSLNAQRFGESNWDALNKLWTRESNWNTAARNASSGACGIPQALPCSKISDMSLNGQIQWGLSYIANRYGTPNAAWNHSQRYGWY